MAYVIQGTHAAAVAAKQEIEEHLPLFERPAQNTENFIKRSNLAAAVCNKLRKFRRQKQSGTGLDQRLLNHPVAITKGELLTHPAADLEPTISSRILQETVQWRGKI